LDLAEAETCPREVADKLSDGQQWDRLPRANRCHENWQKQKSTAKPGCARDGRGGKRSDKEYYEFEHSFPWA